MKKIVAFAVLSFLVFGCSTVSHQSEFRAEPVVVDGVSNEWLLPLNYYDMETQLNYAFANDKENFYICIRAAEPAAKKKVLRMGINLGIEVEDKKGSQKITLLYPNPPKDINKERDQEKDYTDESRKIRKKDLGYLGEMQLTGFNDKIPTSLLPQNDFGINVAVKMDSNNVLVYEAVIPFKTFYKQSLSSSDCKKDWTLTVKLAGITGGGEEGKRIRNNPDPSGGGAMGGGGMGAGGMGGGRGGMGGGRGGMGGGGRGGRTGGGGQPNPAAESGSFKVAFRPVLK